MVEPADYRVAEGPLQVTEAVVTRGASTQPEATVLEAAALSRVGVVVAPNAGAAADLPEAGTAITQGQVLLEVGDTPLPVLLGDEPYDRDLSEGVEGDDVARLEQALAALGFDADGDLVVDEEYDDATRQALLDWERDLGITEDGVFQPAQALVGRRAPPSPRSSSRPTTRSTRAASPLQRRRIGSSSHPWRGRSPPRQRASARRSLPPVRAR